MVAEGDGEDEDDIAELCEAMYEQSAKCNVNLEDAQTASYVVSLDNASRFTYGMLSNCNCSFFILQVSPSHTTFLFFSTLNDSMPTSMPTRRWHVVSLRMW